MIYLGSDHAGYELKKAVARHLESTGQEYQDLGNTELDPADDYPDFAFAVGTAVAARPNAAGIVICGSAQGVCMAANKVKGVRAVAATNDSQAKRTREHNDANVLCLSGWDTSTDDVVAIVDTFLATPFSGEPRHARRLGKISTYESHG